MRTISEKEYTHERLGDKFETALSNYDTCRRVQTLVDEFLGRETLAGQKVLDVGCGLGFFSARLVERGASVTACDIGPELVKKTSQRAKCEALVADALALEAVFGPGTFDGVVSSECIEHTPDPRQAIRQMAAMLKPGGWLSLSTPNLAWYPVVAAATKLRLRPFDGYENFSSIWALRRTFKVCGLAVEREYGLHCWPFQLPCHRLSAWCDRHMQFARGAMINLCFLGRKV